MTARRSSDSLGPPPSIDAPFLPPNHPLVSLRLRSPSLPAYILESLDELPSGTERPTELFTEYPTDPPPPYPYPYPSPPTRRAMSVFRGWPLIILLSIFYPLLQGSFVYVHTWATGSTTNAPSLTVFAHIVLHSYFSFIILFIVLYPFVCLVLSLVRILAQAVNLL
ncbi:hypothetical protein FB446DRAFT_739478 [Lentinula raphanica]|nr:hypothetical protein FB446DRAFT_739478 [Lentinula raphanica]